MHLSDNECKGSLVCFQRDGNGANGPVPGCTGSGKSGWDYCVDKDDWDDYDDGDDDDGDDDDGDDDDGDDDDGDDDDGDDDDGDDDDGDDDDGDDDDGDDDDGGDKKELKNANNGNIEDGKLLGRCKGDCDDGTSSSMKHTLLL